MIRITIHQYERVRNLASIVRRSQRYWLRRALKAERDLRFVQKFREAEDVAHELQIDLCEALRGRAESAEEQLREMKEHDSRRRRLYYAAQEKANELGRQLEESEAARHRLEMELDEVARLLKLAIRKSEGPRGG